MKIYIDFDGTMFDTSKFYKDFLKICNSYGVSDEDVYNIRNQSTGLFNLDELANSIDQKYNLSKKYLDEVNALYNRKYLYDDVIDFLEKNYQKYDLYILTYGEKNYQQKKIDCCNIRDYFKDVIITSDKGKENIDYQSGWFIDNNPKELETLSRVGASKIIRIKRKGDTYFSIPCNIDLKEYFAFSNIDVL